jgi:hypothetical protein
MTLRLSAINPQQELRQFSCVITRIESGFELLTSIVAQGEMLLSAELIDEGNKPTPLPVEAFDGVSCLSTLKLLEYEWTAILAVPISSCFNLDAQHRDWYRAQLYGYEKHIVRLELLISDINRICQRAEEAQSPADERFISHSRAILSCYEAQLAKTHRIRNRLLEGFQAI